MRQRTTLVKKIGVGFLLGATSIALFCCAKVSDCVRERPANSAYSAGRPIDPAAVGRWEDTPVITPSVASLREGVGNFEGATSLDRQANRASVADTRVLRSCATDELWVIERAPRDAWNRAPVDDDFGPGALVTTPPGETREVAVPLEHTDVRARIDAYIATVDVRQSFHNPYSGKIEAVYVFPLPDNSAVCDFVMSIGDRHIRGIIREREEAQRVYNSARQQGYTASLLTQERPNIFTQKVANIEPGRSIDVTIRYYNTLTFDGDAYEFAFPMVVGPRFNPPGARDGIGAAGRGASPWASGQPTQVQYLSPNERAGNDIAIAVDIDATVPIVDVSSPTHAISVSRTGATTVSAALTSGQTIPNRDFVLRYRVAAGDIGTGIAMHRDGRDPSNGYFTMIIVPPAELSSAYRAPVEMVFVIDRSGSMKGRPIEQAREATRAGIRRLQLGDSFQVIDFSDSASKLGRRTLEADSRNIRGALEYVDSLDAAGGTMMLNGLRAALDFPRDGDRQRYVCFLTDGFIGNESEILGTQHDRLGKSRVFAFGMGSSVNRYLINAMGRVGNGASGFVLPSESPAQVMEEFFDRISHPALTNLDIDWGGAQVSEVFPRQFPDLFVGRPVIITGRINGEWRNPVRLRGRAAGRDFIRDVSPPASYAKNRPAIAAIWARAKITELSDRAIWSNSSRPAREITRVALEYGLMSPYTAMIAVDAATRTDGAYGTTVTVPVSMPEGVRYETTVPNERR